jgi:hypothetical protein
MPRSILKFEICILQFAISKHWPLPALVRGEAIKKAGAAASLVQLLRGRIGIAGKRPSCGIRTRQVSC